MGLIEITKDKYISVNRDNLILMKELGIPRNYRKEIIRHMSTFYRKVTLSSFFLRTILQDYLESGADSLKVGKNLEKISGITFSS